MNRFFWSCGRFICSERQPHAFQAAPVGGGRWLLRTLAAVLTLFSLHLAFKTYVHTGLFIPLASDYGLYLSQAMVLQENEDPQRIYDRLAIDRNLKLLLNAHGHDPSYRPGTSDLWGTHVPYPPVFAWTMQALSSLPTGWSVTLWTALNFALVLLLSLRLASHCPQWDRITILLCVLASYPVVLTLFIGQLQIVMAWALMECLLAFRAGKDLQAGLWLGVLLLKPQYGLLLGPVLLWKQRWRAVLGVSVAGMVLLGGSIVAVGLPALLAYPESFSVMAQFRGDDPFVMINWRSLVLDAKPDITDRSGMLITLVMGCLTVACILYLWRGAWRPSTPTFSHQWALTVLATLLVSYHSHPYGAVLLASPIALLLTNPRISSASKGIACTGLFLPTVCLTLGFEQGVSNQDFYRHLLLASQVLKGCLFLLLGSLLIDWFLSTATTHGIVLWSRGLWRKILLGLGRAPVLAGSHVPRRQPGARRR